MTPQYDRIIFDLTIDPMPGTSIDRTAEAMVDLHKHTGVTIKTSFNGCKLKCEGFATKESIVNEYYNWCKKS